MGKEKSAKGQKIGRHTRGNSNKMQAQRTERSKNKRRALADKAGCKPMPPTPHELREVMQERKELIQQRKHAEHKRAFRDAIAAARRSAAAGESNTIQGTSVTLVIPKGLNPKDYREAMKARIRAHRAGRAG